MKDEIQSLIKHLLIISSKVFLFVEHVLLFKLHILKLFKIKIGNKEYVYLLWNAVFFEGPYFINYIFYYVYFIL